MGDQSPFSHGIATLTSSGQVIPKWLYVSHWDVLATWIRGEWEGCPPCLLLSLLWCCQPGKGMATTMPFPEKRVCALLYASPWSLPCPHSGPLGGWVEPRTPWSQEMGSWQPIPGRQGAAGLPLSQASRPPGTCCIVPLDFTYTIQIQR